MNKGQNILYNTNIKRLVEYGNNFKQLNILDKRFYTKDNEYYPSVSTILNSYPKGKYYEEWLKSYGFNAEIIANKAAEEGSQVHDACERFIKGEQIKWINPNSGELNYSLEVWTMILKFAEFWNKIKPELIASEYHLFSDKYKYAGTADLIIKFNDELWLIDIKTSNSLHTPYELQLGAYANAWNEMHSEKITNTGILWLKASTRTEGKQGAIQGKGWQLKVVNEIERNLEIFNKIYDIYKIENPNDKPIIQSLPTSIELE